MLASDDEEKCDNGREGDVADEAGSMNEVLEDRHMGGKKGGRVVTCQGVKTATSLVVSVVVPPVLDEWFVVHVAHRCVVESRQNVGDVRSRRTRVQGIRRRWSSSHL